MKKEQYVKSDCFNSAINLLNISSRVRIKSCVEISTQLFVCSDAIRMLFLLNYNSQAVSELGSYIHILAELCGD